jgi:hypothetical protein
MGGVFDERVLMGWSRNLYEGIDRGDIINNRSRPRIFGVTLGWKMNTGRCNRCFMALPVLFLILVIFGGGCD